MNNNESNPQNVSISEPLYTSVADALRIGGFGRAKLYELLGDRAIIARKLGRRTLIDLRSLRTYLENLPAAQIGVCGRATLTNARNAFGSSRQPSAQESRSAAEPRTSKR